MDADQKLICKVLGKTHSFQSVFNSQKRPNYPFRAANNEHMQLLHDGNNNWLLFFVPVAMFRYAIAWKTTLVGLRRGIWMHFIKISKVLQNWHCHFCLFKNKKTQHFCNCICRRDSGWKVFRWYTIWKNQ